MKIFPRKKSLKKSHTTYVKKVGLKLQRMATHHTTAQPNYAPYWCFSKMTMKMCGANKEEDSAWIFIPFHSVKGPLN